MFISAFMSVRLTFKSDHSAMCSAFECVPVNNVVFAGEHQLIVLRRKMQGRVRLTNSDRWFLIQLYRWFPSILITLYRCIAFKANSGQLRTARQHQTGRAPAGAAPLPELPDQLNRYTMTHILRTQRFAVLSGARDRVRSG
jgi:hypothetical protein